MAANMEYSPEKRSKAELLRRARSKYLSTKLARSLLALNSPLRKQYMQSLYCCSTIVVDSNEIKSSYYCKNRWCQNCQRVLMSKIISKYQPQLEQLDDLYFVTLTAPTVPASMLPNQIERFLKAWQKITNQARRDRSDFKGVRKSECKPKYRGDGYYEYHFHYHIIISGKENAEWLVAKWLKLNKDCSPQAQDYRSVSSLEAGVLELFKYMTKLTFADDAGNEISSNARELDVIFTAMFGKRIYQPFGGLKAAKEDDIEIVAQEIIAVPGIYEWHGTDWVHTEYGTLLSNYSPDKEDTKIWITGTS